MLEGARGLLEQDRSGGLPRDRVSQTIEVFDNRDKAKLTRPSCERKLMVIDGFAMERTPWDDDRVLPEGERRDDGARTRVNHDHPGASHMSAKLVVRQKIDAIGAPRPKPGRAILHD